MRVRLCGLRVRTTPDGSRELIGRLGHARVLIRRSPEGAEPYELVLAPGVLDAPEAPREALGLAPSAPARTRPGGRRLRPSRAEVELAMRMHRPPRS